MSASPSESGALHDRAARCDLHGGNTPRVEHQQPTPCLQRSTPESSASVETTWSMTSSSLPESRSSYVTSMLSPLMSRTRSTTLSMPTDTSGALRPPATSRGRMRQIRLLERTLSAAIRTSTVVTHSHRNAAGRDRPVAEAHTGVEGLLAMTDLRSSEARRRVLWRNGAMLALGVLTCLVWALVTAVSILLATLDYGTEGETPWALLAVWVFVVFTPAA